MKVFNKKYSGKLIHTIVAVAVCFGVISCSTSGKDKDATIESVTKPKEVDRITLTKEQNQAVGIKLGSVQKQMVSEEIKVNGQVDLPPGSRATVSLPISGKIKLVNVLPGQAVRKGEVLATLESFEFIQMQQDYLQNSNQLIFLNKEMERQKTLTNEHVGARKNYEQAEANYRSTKALVQSLEAKLQMLGIPVSSLNTNGKINATVPITSPVTGYVSTTNVNLGKETTPGQALFEIVDKRNMHIELTVFEKDASKIKEEQKVIVRMNDNPEKINATVHLVGKTLEGESRTLNVHAHINNKKSEINLIPGAYVNAWIMTGSRMANVVPVATVVRKGEHGYIFTQEKPNEFKRIKVQIGSSTDNGNVEIISPENLENRQLVTTGAYLLDAEFAKRSEPEAE